VTRRAKAPAATATAAPPRALGLLANAIVFAAGCAVFLPTLGYAFLNWDDNVYVVQNPWIRALSWENVKGIFTQPYFQNYLPLHLFSYMIDHALWGLRAMGYHLSSVLLHGLNTVLCLAVVRRMSRSLMIAFLAALLFAVHPAHVEAVAWVSSRKEVLSTTFLLLSLLFYVMARSGGSLRTGPYVASVAAFLLAMLSKVSVVVLPAFLLALDAMPAGTGSRPRPRPSLARALLEKIPYGIVGAVLIFVNSRVQVTARAAYAHEPLRYLSVKGHAVWNYVGLLFGSGNSPDYDLPVLDANPFGVPLALAGWVLFPAAAFVLYRARRRLEFLGVVWVFITLLPALLFPLVTYMAERYLYAPSVGICWAIAAAAVGLTARRGTLAKGAAVAVMVALVSFFTVRTIQYSRVWSGSEALWTYALTKSRDYRVYNNLAQVRMEEKRWDEAERLLRRGALVENVVSHQSLGVMYYTLGRFPEALVETDRAIEIQARKRPDASVVAELRFNRGAVLWSLGRTGEAADAWRAALEANPRHAQAREWLGVAERSTR
jgi:hypothetical protein